LKALVTGGNGFIGSALVKKLIDSGFEVRCLANRSSSRLQSLPVEIVQGSVTDRAVCAKAVAGMTQVFHLAARATDWGRREQFFSVNAEGTRNIAQACAAAGVRRLVLMSSLAVHRFIGYVDGDESAPADQNRYGYGASKVAAEQIVHELGKGGRLETVIVRPGAVVFGAEDTTAFIYMAPLLERGRWTHVARGRPLICCSQVENLADGLVLAGTHPRAAGGTFLITDDLKLSWKEFISAAIVAFGQKERTLSFPVTVARTAGPALEALYRFVGAQNPPPITDYRTALVCKDFHFGCQRAKALLGYQPRISLQEGLRQAVDWYRQWKARERA